MSRSSRPGQAVPLLAVKGLTKTFRVAGGSWGRGHRLRAVDSVTFDVGDAETFGLVGESGSGKTTTARLLLRLLDPDAGSVQFGGAEVTTMGRRELRALRREMQVVFQDPYSSLDPTWPVADIVAEPLRTHRVGASETDRRGRVAGLLERVGLDARYAGRLPHELSGGQRQRVAIARALALNPRLIVCDEPVSALDVSTQAQVVALLAELQQDLGLAYLFIAHDLVLVRHVSRRIGVMLLGRLIEVGPADDVYHEPLHPYTQALVTAVPVADPRRQRSRSRIVLGGDADASAHGRGCSFAPRCPLVIDRCRSEAPPLVEVAPGRSVACHLHRPGQGAMTVPLAGAAASAQA